MKELVQLKQFLEPVSKVYGASKKLESKGRRPKSYVQKLECEAQQKTIFELTSARLNGSSLIEMEHAIGASPHYGKNGFGDGKSFAKAGKGKAGWSQYRIEKILEYATKEPNPIFTYEQYQKGVMEKLNQYQINIELEKIEQFRKIIQHYLLLSDEFSHNGKQKFSDVLKELQSWNSIDLI